MIDFGIFAATAETILACTQIHDPIRQTVKDLMPNATEDEITRTLGACWYILTENQVPLHGDMVTKIDFKKIPELSRVFPLVFPVREKVKLKYADEEDKKVDEDDDKEAVNVYLKFSIDELGYKGSAQDYMLGFEMWRLKVWMEGQFEKNKSKTAYLLVNSYKRHKICRRKR
jgi:hypothetical protein